MCDLKVLSLFVTIVSVFVFNNTTNQFCNATYTVFQSTPSTTSLIFIRTIAIIYERNKELLFEYNEVIKYGRALSNLSKGIPGLDHPRPYLSTL